MKRETAKPKPQSGIRIIGGSLKRSKLNVVKRDGLRPTPDRTRETLFNWLMPFISGAVVLDCFAGSGALGLEALSRGAYCCTFVETDREIARQIEANLTRFEITDQASVTLTDALILPRDVINKASIIFADPPFNKGMTQEFLTQIREKVRPDSRVVLECERNEDLNLEGFEVIRELKAGTDCMRLLRPKP